MSRSMRLLGNSGNSPPIVAGEPAMTIWDTWSSVSNPGNTAMWDAVPLSMPPVEYLSAEPRKDSHWKDDGRLQVPEAPVKPPPSTMTRHVVAVRSRVTLVRPPSSQSLVLTTVVVAARVILSATVKIIWPGLAPVRWPVQIWNVSPSALLLPRIRIRSDVVICVDPPGGVEPHRDADAISQRRVVLVGGPQAVA